MRLTKRQAVALYSLGFCSNTGINALKMFEVIEIPWLNPYERNHTDDDERNAAALLRAMADAIEAKEEA